MIVLKNHIDVNSLTNGSLKKLLVDNNIGIDCSGFAYYILDAVSQASNKGPISKHIKFVNCSGILGRFYCSLRPATSIDVSTLADDANSHEVKPREVEPGDIITMISNEESAR